MAIWVTLVVLVCRQCHCWGQEACWSIAPVQSLLKRMRPSWHGPWIHSVSCCSLLTRWWTMMYSRQPCISWAYFESKKWTEYSSLQLASPVTTTGTCMSHRITSGRDSSKSGPKDQVALHYFAFALVHDSRPTFTISLALSAGTLMASAGTLYRLVPAHFYPWAGMTFQPLPQQGCKDELT